MGKTAQRRFGKDSRPDDEVKTDALSQLVRELRRCDDFLEEAEESYRYVFAHQGAWETDAELFAININQTRGSQDRKVAKILDAQPEMEIEGTGGHVLSGVDEWDDLIDWQRRWTGDYNDAWLDQLPKIVFQSKWIGEGMAEFGYDSSEDGGQGMVIGRYSDSTQWVWSADSQSAQLRDADRLFCVEVKRTEWLKDEYPDYDILPQGIDWLRQQVYKGLDQLAAEDLGSGPVGDDFDSSVNQFLNDDQEPLSWRIRRWTKKRRRVKRFYDTRTGDLLMRPAKDGEKGADEGGRVPVDEAWIKGTGVDKESYVPRDIILRELWETVIAGDQLVQHELCKYDRSRGGSGHYPVARMSNIWDPRRPKAHGDVEFERSFDDLSSNMATRWVEALFIGNANWVDTVAGAYAPQEEHKLEMLGERSFQKIKRYPGMPAAEVRGVQTQGPNLFAAGINFLQELADDARRIYDVNRGSMPYETSGRGIRSLLAEAAVVENLDKQRMESFLRQEAFLRICMSQQFLGQPFRLLPINNQRTNRRYLLAVGNTRENLIAHFDLEELHPEAEMPGSKVDPKPTGLYQRKMDPHGEHVRILALEEYGDPGRVQVRMRLTAGAERSKAEKLDLVETFTAFASKLPPEYLEWAAEVADAPNKDGLKKASARVQARNDLTKQLEGMLSEFDLSWQEAQQAMQMAGEQKRGMVAPGGMMGGNGRAVMGAADRGGMLV